MVKFRYSWKIRKLQFLFPLKDPIILKVNVIYKETCTCKSYILEKPNITLKFDRTNIALLRKPLK